MDWHSCMKKGDNAYDSGRYSEAVDWYTRSLRLIADMQISVELVNWYLIYSNRGASYYSIGDYTKALADLNKAIDYLPESAHRDYYHRGLCYKELGDFEGAIKDFTKSIDINKGEDAFALNERGVVYVMCDNFKSAKHDFESALKIDTNHVSAQQNLNRLLSMM